MLTQATLWFVFELEDHFLQTSTKFNASNTNKKISKSPKYLV